MKTIHIIIILIMVLIMAVVITTLSDSGTYSTFAEAAKNPGMELHIIGKLDRSTPIDYDVFKDPNRFSFFMVDGNGDKIKVVYHNSKPQDFEKSEKVVVIGAMEGDQFVASSLLLKCPSKYKEEKPTKFSEKKFGI